MNVICNNVYKCKGKPKDTCYHTTIHKHLGLICNCKCPHFGGSCVDVTKTRKEKLKKLNNLYK